MAAALALSGASEAGVPPAAAAPKTAAPDPRAWPTVYEPVTLTAGELLAAVRRADGGKPERDTLRVTYDVRDGGLSGTEREVFRGDDYRSDAEVGPFITADGRLHGQAWELGENGYTLLKAGIHQRTQANTRALERADPGDDVRVLGRLRNPADTFVLLVAPKDGRPELRFYEAASYHLVRRETHYLDRLVVTTYDDYRTVGAITTAYRTTYSDGHPENDGVRSVRELRVGDPVTDRDLQIPSGRRRLYDLPPGVERLRLPARIDKWGAVIVRLTIDGRGLDFQLDSGCSGITLNRGVAHELGLKTYGNWSQTVAGTFTTAKAIVPEMRIGPIVMHDVVVDALPMAFQNDESTKIVGLLGYDFIAGSIIKIDYERGTVDALPYDTPFPHDALVVDAALDDGVPMIAVTVNGKVGERFIIDTGAWDIVLFSGFAQRNAGAISDHSPGQIISRWFNLVTSEGVGGALHTRGIGLERFKIGPIVFNDFIAEVMSGDQPAFEGEDTDGLVGAAVLSAFDVYLDYANARVAFVLNDSAKHHRAARGLGSTADQ